MAKVLLTGATGFIGRRVLPKLVREGLDVVALSRGGQGGVALNLFDQDAVRRLLEKERPEYLVHLAWNVETGYMENPENIEWVMAGLGLLKAFAENGGKRVLLAGSCIEYDWAYGFLSEELTPLNPISLYGICKVSFSKMASIYAQKMGLSLAWGRIFFLYGEGEREWRLMPSLIHAFTGNTPPNLRYPHIRRDYMHVDDVAGALAAVLLSPFEGAVNIASDTAVPLCEIAERIARLMGRPIPEWPQSGGEDIAPLVLGDARRLNHVIGFTPRVSLEEGLAGMVKSCS